MTRKEIKEQTKQLYLELLAQVNKLLPSNFADKVKEANPELKYSTIINARYGRACNLELLVFMVETCLPGFEIEERFKQSLTAVA